MIARNVELRRHLRPGRHPRPRRHGARLLRGARHHPRAVEPGPRPVQGLHRDAQVQHVPVAAHHGHRPRRQARRAADPHLGHAQAGRVRRRRALEVQGRDGAHGPSCRRRAQREQGQAKKGDEAAEMAWLRQLVDWQRETEDPAEFLDSLRFDLAGAEVYVFTPRGEVIALPQGATPGRLRLRDPHRGRPPHDRRPRQRPPRRPGVHPGQRRHRGDLHLQGAGGRARAATGSNFVKSARARNKIRQWFSKERREAAVEAGKDQIAKVMRKQGLPLQRLTSADDAARRSPGAPLPGPVRAVRRGRRGPDQRPVGGRQAGPRGQRRRRARRRTWPRPRLIPPRRRGPGHARQRTPASRSRARRTSGSGCPSAAPRSRATRSRASSRTATASPCTARTASTSRI